VLLTTGSLGDTRPEAADAADSPAADRATTVTVYVSPAAPPRTQVVAPVVEQVAGPGLAIAR
jgi:hypothetical protein